MPAIRVLIGDMPPLLRSLVEGMLDDDPQFEITSNGQRPGAAAHPDVLVISESAMSRIVPLSALPEGGNALGVVAIAANGLDAAVVRLSAYRRRIDCEPRQTLSEAILDAARAAPEVG